MSVSAPIAGAIIAFAGVLLGLWLNGDRAERQRVRELHARALTAITAYGEMPFMVRRRRFEATEQSAERVRLSDRFSEIKAEVHTCQLLLAADGDTKVALAFEKVIEVAQHTAGREAHEAWTQPAIRSDAEMNMSELSESLAPFRSQLNLFKDELAHSTLPRRKRLRRALRQGRAGGGGRRGVNTFT